MGIRASEGKAPTLTHVLCLSSDQLVPVASLPRASGRGRPSVWCPICGRLGEYVFSATPHFRHANDEPCNPGAAESALHRYLKALLRRELEDSRRSRRVLAVATTCWRCQHPTVVPLPVSWSTEREEVSFGDFLADVAALDGDSLRLVFEVCVTNPISESKISHLQSLGVPLLEWGADAFLAEDGEARWRPGEPLPAPRTFQSPPQFPICPRCRAVPPRAQDAASMLEGLDPSNSHAIDLRRAFGHCPVSFTPREFLRHWAGVTESKALPEFEFLARIPADVLLAPSGRQLLERLERPHGELLDSAEERDVPSEDSVEFASAEALYEAHVTPSQRLREERLDVLVLQQIQGRGRSGDTLASVGSVIAGLADEDRAVARTRVHRRNSESKPYGHRAGYLGTSRSISCERDIWRTLHRRVADDGASRPQTPADARTRSLTLITGGPGTGKTTSIRRIISDASRAGARAGSWWVCAPTHKALARLRETTTHECSSHHTVHAAIRLLRQDRTRRPTGIIVDEASFLDVQLAAQLLVEGEDVRHLVLVGDEAQLPSVGPGAVLRDVLRVFPVAAIRLNQNFRATSDLAEAGRAMREGRRPSESSALTIEYCSDADVEARSRWWLQKLYREHPVADVQALAAKNELVAALNLWALTTGVPGLPPPVRGALRPGDRAVVAGFDWSAGNVLYKGLVGTVTKDGHLLPDRAESSTVLDASVDLQAAYALTIHKSQGSEWPVVLLSLPRKMLTRNLVYTAFTRARSKVVIVAADGALEAALARLEARPTCLSRWIPHSTATRFSE